MAVTGMVRGSLSQRWHLYTGIPVSNVCGAFTAAAFSGMMPLTSMILSVIILGEQAGWQQWLAEYRYYQA